MGYIQGRMAIDTRSSLSAETVGMMQAFTFTNQIRPDVFLWYGLTHVPALDG